MLPARDTAAPRLALLSSPTAQALRDERGGLVAWAGGVALFAFVLGVVSEERHVGATCRTACSEQLAKLGSASLATPTGYLGVRLRVLRARRRASSPCAQVGAARHAEAEQQLETLFAQPVGRRAWLGGRLALAACAAAASVRSSPGC